MSEAEVTEQPRIGAVEGRPDVTVVTQENFSDYVTQQMGGTVEPVEAEETVNEDPAEIAKADLAAMQKAAEDAKKVEPKEGDIDGAKVFFNGKWVGKHDFNYRVHLKSEEAKKDAQAKIDLAESQAKTIREQLAAAEKERNELKAKYEPPEPLEVGPEPNEADYADMAKFKADLKAWSAKNARAEDAKAQQEQKAKAAQEAAVRGWNERQEAVKKEFPDYAEKVNNSAVIVSDQMREAIIESEVGPKILYHFAEHPEIAEALGKLSVRKMLVELGKLESNLGSAEKPQTKSAEVKVVAEISKAPAPITPLKGGHAVDGLKIDAQGNWTGTAEEYKAARRAGKIK